MPRIVPQGPPPKVRATLYLPADLLNEMRNAAVHLAGYPARLTLAKLAELALRSELARLKDKYNGGADFPERGEDLKGAADRRMTMSTTPRSTNHSTSAAAAAQREALRRELLKQIVRNEAQRRDQRKATDS